MIFLIEKIRYTHDVVIYESISDLTSSVEWQDIFERQLIIIDDKGIEYEWDSTLKNEIGTIYDYTIISTLRKSNLLNRCLEEVQKNENITEFKF